MQEKSVVVSPSGSPSQVSIEAVAANGTSQAGSIAPLVDVALEVLPSAVPKVYPRAMLIAQQPELTSASRLTNILAGNVTYFDSSGQDSTGLSLTVTLPKPRGLLLTSTSSPIFDLKPGTGGPASIAVTLGCTSVLVSACANVSVSRGPHARWMMLD
jgi:hypothetical protein